jgi:putative restriction endonuclease
MAAPDAIDAERAHREASLAQLERRGGSRRAVAPALVNELRIFYGGGGIWYDAQRTRTIEPPGITMGLLHTGRHYADALEADGLLYYYPVTKDPGKDRAEVEATKNAGELGLPVFVVVDAGAFRDVHVGWVTDSDDEQGCFLVQFGDASPAELPAPDDDDALGAFEMFSDRKRRTVIATERVGQQGFAFRVLKRYGAECAACGLTATGLIDAAHVVPDVARGTQDPRNGLPFCPTHHRAYDRHLFAVDPMDLSLHTADGVTASDLRITRTSITHLKRQPHRDVLKWNWRRFKGS